MLVETGCQGSLMRYYCPNCWADFWNEDPQRCPSCGYNLRQHDEQDYVSKLLLALDHKAGDIRHWAIMVLAKRRERRAIPALERIRDTSHDPSLQMAATQALRKIVDNQES